MTASAQHLEHLHALIQSGRHPSKTAAVSELIAHHPKVRQGYKSMASALKNTLAAYRKHYGADPLPRPPLQRSAPLEGWSSEEKRRAADQELLCTNVRLAKQKQAQCDRNRIETKAFRQHARIENALEAYGQALVEQLALLQDYLPDYRVRTGKLNPEAAAIVVHLSDLHFNELIDQPDNRYDFEVAARRLEKLAGMVRLQGQAFGVERVVICCGGDFLNSDRRLDELLHMATNRARATILAAHILEHFIRDLRQDFFLDVFGITGNEGRAKDELGWSDLAVTDNYDAQIFYILQMILGGSDPGLRFHRLQGNEAIFSVHRETFLLVHGHQVNCNDQKKVQSMIGQKSAALGVRITHVLAGHIHASLVGDYVSRNASLAGANAYSEDALQLASKAAQNIHIVTTDSLFGLKVDLQHVEGYEGYPIIEELCAYNAKSHAKAYQASRPITPVVVVI